jgi:SAM-dependent methyltransferase
MRSRSELIGAFRRKGASPSQILTLLQIRKALEGCTSVLDIGCGSDSPLALFGFEHLIGYEGYEPSLKAAAQKGTHQELILGKVQDLEKHFRPGQFDACVAMDVIEHISKADGLKLLQAMERIASRDTVILTPNGFLPQGHTDGADLQEHLSGWEPAEMRRLGYKVAGVLGPKYLRGEYHRLRRGPEWLWGTISLAGQVLISRWWPSSAAAILCVKSTRESKRHDDAKAETA